MFKRALHLFGSMRARKPEMIKRCLMHLCEKGSFPRRKPTKSAPRLPKERLPLLPPGSISAVGFKN
jgi:hypothetical protein